MPPKKSFVELGKKNEGDDKVRSSVFVFTVNSNEKMSEDKAEEWMAVMRDMWHDPSILLVSTIKEHQIGEFNQVNPEYVKSIETQIVFEVGDKFKKLHMHGSIKVLHTSNIRLAFTQIHQILKEFNGDAKGTEGPPSTGKAQYFKAHTTQDAGNNISEYMRKHQTSVERFYMEPVKTIK